MFSKYQIQLIAEKEIEKKREGRKKLRMIGLNMSDGRELIEDQKKGSEREESHFSGVTHAHILCSRRMLIPF